jgi:5-methylcytosine-specific restriction endonuclease McrA
MTEKYSKAFLTQLKAVTNKRARIVIDHILEHGFITTEELETQYGYKHPPRAARDVREQGIPLETFRVKTTEGRSIAAYRFADPSQIRMDRLGGRKVFSKTFKNSLIEARGLRCAVCQEKYERRYLQVDHRIPYEISGSAGSTEQKLQDYMLLCGSCNRAKSWSCEHCANWYETKSPELCDTCYWAHPESYKHIALKPIRRLDLVWTEDEVEIYEKLKHQTDQVGEAMPDYVKKVISKHLEET